MLRIIQGGKVSTFMVEGDVDYEGQEFIVVPPKAEATWRKILSKLFDLRKCQTHFARCGQYLQRFPASLGDRAAKKLK